METGRAYGEDGARVGLHQVRVLEVIIDDHPDLAAAEVTVGVLGQALAVVQVVVGVVILLTHHANLGLLIEYEIKIFDISQKYFRMPDHRAADGERRGSAWRRARRRGARLRRRAGGG